MKPYIIQSLALILILLILIKKSLKVFNTNNINYTSFQLRYFLIKATLCGTVVLVFCLFYPMMKKGLIIYGMVVFLLSHFLEAFIYEKLFLMKKNK